MHDSSAIDPLSVSIPLCVDLDGSLVKSDTLIDSLLVLVRSHPTKALALPFKVLKGKAAFKAYVTDYVDVDVEHLPYNRKLLHYLQSERARGRAIYLATGADIRLANRVADYLGIFSGVLGSDGAVNLTGNAKLDRLRASLGTDRFDYIGNDRPDLPLLEHAAHPMVANPTMRLRAAMRAHGLRPAMTFDERVPFFRSLLRAARVHQWAKNLLVFLPVLLGHNREPALYFDAALAFFCFSLAASATYIINDLLDIEADRRHRRKRDRPFAAGDLSAAQGASVSVIFLGLAVWGSIHLPIAFSAWLAFYLGLTLAYTAYLKRVPIVDVVVLSGLYTVRMIAGSAVTHTRISHWLAGFSVFLFLSLAFVKRFAELENLSARGVQPGNGRGYLLIDRDQLRSFGTSSAYASVVIFAIYISGSDVTALYSNPWRLWLVVPFMILWLSRVWLLASRGELNEDPVVFALTDRMSLLIGVAVVLIVLLAI